MVKAGKKSKHSLLIWFMGILGAVLAVRLSVLTVFQEDKWSAYADDMSMRVVYENGPRGDIIDRNGEIIATSRKLYSVNISRVNIDKEDALTSAAEVMLLLKEQDEDVRVTPEEVQEILEDTGYNAYMPIVLAEDISQETAERIEAAGYPGVKIAENYIREYPNGALASHVVGYLGRISQSDAKTYVEEKGYRKDALIGKSGIEKIYEDRLKGTDALSTFQVDSRGNVTRLLSESRPQKGKTVKLTLDLRLQQTTEEALEQAIKQAACGGSFQSEYGNYQMSYAKNAAVGAAVALDVNTGQVLAMSSYPDFDPNDFAVSISAEKWRSLQRQNENDPLSPSPLYNVAAMSAVQPGSTFKPVTALAALSCGLDRNQYLYDAGFVSMGGRTFGCSLWNDKKATHGYVDLKEAMQVSCNYYFYDIATGMDLASGHSLRYTDPISNETILRFAKLMGLGEKTGIEIEESAGLVPSKAVKQQSIKSSLQNYLLAESETYFKKRFLKERQLLRKNIKKIVNWSDKDLTLEEIIGKLKKMDFIKDDKIRELAEICKYSYFNQARWTKGDTFNISIGQGDNAYTPLQMANYMATLGNGGVKNQVSLVSGSLESTGKVAQNAGKEANSTRTNANSAGQDLKDGGDHAESTESAGQDAQDDGQTTKINRADIEYVIDAMTGVTQSDGSLFRAFGSFPYSVAAKTGTAQRAGKINVSDERDYLKRHLHLIAPDVTFSRAEDEAARLLEEYPDVYETEADALRRAVINLSKHDITASDIDRYKEGYDNFAWTVALAPAEDPQIAVAVLLVQGKTSANAAPVAREIIGKYGEISQWEK